MPGLAQPELLPGALLAAGPAAAQAPGALGRAVARAVLPARAGARQLPVSQLPPGCYVVRGQQAVARLVVE